MKKYRNFETMWIDLAEALKEFLDNNIIEYEISGAFSCIHFEILCDNEETKEVNDFLDDYCMNHHEYV